MSEANKYIWAAYTYVLMQMRTVWTIYLYTHLNFYINITTLSFIQRDCDCCDDTTVYDRYSQIIVDIIQQFTKKSSVLKFLTYWKSWVDKKSKVHVCFFLSLVNKNIVLFTLSAMVMLDMAAKKIQWIKWPRKNLLFEWNEIKKTVIVT